MIRILIVDDERPARDGLRVRIGKEPGFEVVGEAASGREAIAALRKLDPDVMFLDIRMPDLSGFDVLKRMPAGRDPHVVFVTAFDQHAIRAFEVHAVDFVVKPIVPRRFKETLRRVRTLHGQRRASVALDRLVREMGDRLPEGVVETDAPRPDRIGVRDGARVTMVPLRSIRWIEACGNYVLLHAEGRPLLHRKTIRELAAELPASEFARVHRSVIVRVSEVVEIRRNPHGGGEVVLRGGQVVKMSRRFRDVLL